MGGVAFMVLSVPLGKWTTKKTQAFQKILMTRKDDRMSVVGETMQVTFFCMREVPCARFVFVAHVNTGCGSMPEGPCATALALWCIDTAKNWSFDKDRDVGVRKNNKCFCVECCTVIEALATLFQDSDNAVSEVQAIITSVLQRFALRHVAGFGLSIGTVTKHTRKGTRLLDWN